MNITKSNSSNRFDFLRLVFASAVFLFHAVALTNLGPHNIILPALAEMAELSIQGFFIISGALVYGSLLNSNGVSDYFGKRLRRLYPAYFVIILTPSIVSLLVSWDFIGVGRYLAANLSFLNFLEPRLPGLFEGQRYSEVNGALWTLKIEVMFYLTLPILAWVMRRMGKFKLGLLAVLYIGAELWRSVMPTGSFQYADELARQLPGQLSFFVAGIILWIYRGWLKKNAHWSTLVGGIVLVLSFTLNLEFLRAAGMAGLVAGIAYLPGIKLNAARWGDISYGVYITHFPIVNMVIAFGLFDINPALGYGICIITVILTSLLLWKYVEKPFLKRSSHYRQVAEQR